VTRLLALLAIPAPAVLSGCEGIALVMKLTAQTCLPRGQRQARHPVKRDGPDRHASFARDGARAAQ
jgi:hypothetical protein